MDNAKRTFSDKVLDWINLILVLMIMIILIYPLYFVLIASISDTTKIFEFPLLLWPIGFNVGSYVKVFENKDIWMGFRNSILYAGLGTMVNLVMTTLVAYPLSRRYFYGKKFFTLLFVFTMFFSGGLIPTYLTNKMLGIIDTVWVMILPGAISVYLAIIMRTFFQITIPQELEESAIVDGCNDFQLLYKIVLPLSASIIAVMALFYGVGHWNSYFNALIYLTSRAHAPLQLILREILVQGRIGNMAGTNVIEEMKSDDYAKRMAVIEGIKYSTVVISSLPVLIIYPMLQKFFEKGILIGSIKG